MENPYCSCKANTCSAAAAWQTTLDAQNRYGEKGVANKLNPKGVTRNELYGYVSIATREWKDGLLSQVTTAQMWAANMDCDANILALITSECALSG